MASRDITKKMKLIAIYATVYLTASLVLSYGLNYTGYRYRGNNSGTRRFDMTTVPVKLQVETQVNDTSGSKNQSRFVHRSSKTLSSFEQNQSTINLSRSSSKLQRRGSIGLESESNDK